MNLLPGTQYVTMNTTLGTQGDIVRIFSIEVISGDTSGGILKLYNGISSSGTNKYIQVDGATSRAVDKSFAGGIRFPSGCWIAVDTMTVSATIVYTEEF